MLAVDVAVCVVDDVLNLLCYVFPVLVEVNLLFVVIYQRTFAVKYIACVFW